MNSNVKGVIFVVLSILSFAWFGYEMIGYISRGGVAPGDNPALEYTFTFLKLVMSISWIIAAINAFRQKN